MPLSYRDMTPPAAEPVTLADVKAQCVIDADNSADNAMLTGLIVAARQYVEKFTSRAIYNRTVKLWLDHFPFPESGSTVNPNDRHCLYGSIWHQLAIRLPRPACVSVESITYIDLGGVEQTLDPLTYYADVNSEPARIVPRPGMYWPYTQSWLPNSVCVTFTAGTYGDGVTVENCPQTIKQAMLLLVSHWYSNRDAAAAVVPREIELGVAALLAGEVFETMGY